MVSFVGKLSPIEFLIVGHRNKIITYEIKFYTNYKNHTPTSTEDMGELHMQGTVIGPLSMKDFVILILFSWIYYKNSS